MVELELLIIPDPETYADGRQHLPPEIIQVTGSIKLSKAVAFQAFDEWEGQPTTLIEIPGSVGLRALISYSELKKLYEKSVAND